MSYEYCSREILVLEYEDTSLERIVFGPTLERMVHEDDFDASTTTLEEYIQSILSVKTYYYVNKEWIKDGVVRKGIENKIKDITKPIQTMYLTFERVEDLF